MNDELIAKRDGRATRDADAHLTSRKSCPDNRFVKREQIGGGAIL